MFSLIWGEIGRNRNPGPPRVFFLKWMIPNAGFFLHNFEGEGNRYTFPPIPECVGEKNIPGSSHISHLFLDWSLLMRRSNIWTWNLAVQCTVAKSWGASAQSVKVIIFEHLFQFKEPFRRKYFPWFSCQFPVVYAQNKHRWRRITPFLLWMGHHWYICSGE